MPQFAQHVLDGVALGSVYASLALALVLIFRSTGVVNLAQGEMAMFSTFIAWALVQAGMPVLPAFGAALVCSLLGGMLVERVLIRPVEGDDPLAILIVTLGLLILLNSTAGWIWGFEVRGFPRALPVGGLEIAGVRLAYESLGMVAVMLVVVALLYLLFQHTRLGLVMRAVSAEPRSSRLVGIPVGRVLMVGWGLAAVVGALAGVLVAPRLLLDVNFMGGVLVYSFAAATVGGFHSPTGAVVGGWLIGVIQTLAGDYVGFIGSDLTILVPLVVIFVVLLVRPSGMFGSRQEVHR